MNRTGNRGNKWKVLFFVFGVIFTGCMMKDFSKKTEPVTIGELAYDVNEKDGYTVYIKENEIYVPFLVITNDYDGNTLLLREEVLEREYPFSENDDDYYAVSLIDAFLNSEYYNCFENSVKELIMDSAVTISKDFPNIFEIEQIQRKIFLLSCSEVNISMGITNTDGETLKYFDQIEHNICYRNGEPAGWWLRSKYLPERSLVWLVSADGTIGGGAVQYLGGVRPAFCISSSTNITKEQVSQKLEGYVLDTEK